MSELVSPEEWVQANGQNITHDLLQGQQGAKSQSGKTFTVLDTNTILETHYPEICWAIPGYLPEGFSVLAGRQKLGKTWLAIDWAVAVATGGCAMGSIPCEQGDVLYIDMENGPRRIQDRIRTFFPDGAPDLGRLRWATEVIPLDAGFTDAVGNWLGSVPEPRLIVIDVLSHIKPVSRGSQNAYEKDYRIFTPLQRWLKARNVALLALHHTKKGGADDPLEALSGSNGLSAVADTTFLLDKDSNGTTLYGRGRDLAEIDVAMHFDGGLWTIQGDAAEVHRSKERSRILSALRDATEPWKPNVIADVTGMKPGNVRRLLIKMVAAGEAQKTGHGQYIHPENAHFVTEEPGIPTPGNSGNSGNNPPNSNSF
ncbi:AAA family ATPase [Roseibium sp.]|uniref:AAA family ATPase n=1 Tax=Roseibium sp. TaxID=1936156 RepID=UPI003BAAAD51